MKKFKVGIQLYSVRDAVQEDMDAALKAVKEMGYDYVEFAGYYDKSAEEIKALLDKHGLECASVHLAPLPIGEEQEAADFLKTIGAKYCAIPWYAKENYVDDWDGTIAKFEKLARVMKENGIQLLYHNHDFEFEKLDGEIILEKLYSTIPSDLLRPEYDVCWVHYAGNNPAEYIAKYDGKLEVLHLKDFVCNSLGGGPVYALIDGKGNDGEKPSKDDNGFEFRPVGYGIQNFPEILEAAEKCGVEYVIVEQDESPDGDPLGDAKKSREYLKSLGI